MVELRKAGSLDYVRFVISSLLLLFSVIVTSYAIWEKKTHFWTAVPGWAALILFIVDLFILGIVEGLQIALVELKRQHPDAYKKTHPAAHRLGQLAAIGDNVERFLMGRQVFVVALVFFAAKLTTITLEDGESFLFPVPQWFESAFLETGFLACIVVVIIAQLMPQIAAAKYPVHFLQFFIMRPAYYACVFVEMTGLTHACWLLSSLLSVMAGMKDDKTTVNPNECPDDIIMEIENSLDCVEVVSSSISGSGSSSWTEDKVDDRSEKSLLNQTDNNTSTKFTPLVDKVNASISPDNLRVLRFYLDRHPEKFHQFPSVVGNKLYPAPHQLAIQMEQDGHQVPKFLTDISDPEHVPPHIVACELLAKNRNLEEELDLIKKKMAAM